MVEVFGSGGGTGGHVIVDENNVEYAQRSKLKIINATVEDDSANDQTLVTVTGGGGGIALSDVSGASVTTSFRTATLKWTDPEDIVVDGIALAEWAGTLVVRKAGSAPANRTDGTVVVNSKTKNQYASTGFTDTNLEYDTTYYYRFFPYTTGSVYTEGSSVNVTPERAVISSLPVKSGDLTYTGNEQTQTFTGYDNTKMTVSGNTGTNAGDYTATFTLNSDYKWWDDTTTAKTVNWSIAKAEGSATLSKTAVTLDPDHLSASVTISNETGTITSVTSADTSIATVSFAGHSIVINNVDQATGTTTINIAIAASENYTAKALTISVTAAFASLDIYGFHHDMSNADPDTCITYISGTANANFAKMMTNEDSGAVTAGGWGSFLTDVLLNKPAMVKKDGTLDYWLDPSDYTKKANGTASDISNSDYSGAGAFSWINKMYMKEEYSQDGESRDVYFAFGEKPDNTYHAVGFIDGNGDELEGVWIPMFYLNETNEKSLAGLYPVESLTTDAQKTKIDTIGSRARFFGGAIMNVLRDLEYMLFKSTDIQKTAGYGNCNGYDSTSGAHRGFKSQNIVANGIVSGFKGTGTSEDQSTRNQANKMFHSNVLGTYDQRIRDPYTILDAGVLKYSDDYEYDVTGATYDTAADTTWGSLSGGWHYGSHLIKTGDNFGSTPKKENTCSNATGLCDGLSCDSSGVRVALRLGICNNGLVDGPAYLYLNYTATYAYWSGGAGVLLLPPKGYAPVA